MVKKIGVKIIMEAELDDTWCSKKQAFEMGEEGILELIAEDMSYLTENAKIRVEFDKICLPHGKTFSWQEQDQTR